MFMVVSFNAPEQENKKQKVNSKYLRESIRKYEKL